MSTQTHDMDEESQFLRDAGLRLEAIRLTLGHDPKDMAKIMQCPRSTYTDYKQGDRPIPAYKLREFVKLGFSADYVYFGSMAGVASRYIDDLLLNHQKAVEESSKPSTVGRPSRSAP